MSSSTHGQPGAMRPGGSSSGQQLDPQQLQEKLEQLEEKVEQLQETTQKQMAALQDRMNKEQQSAAKK